jgi:hypothetical protein
MEKKHRSPSYPQMSIREAVQKIGALYNAIGAHPTSREVIAKGLGYGGLSGASATTIGTLNKYGLLEGRGEEVKVSDRAMAILHPHSKEEHQEALRAAALEPELFRELSERFPGGSAPHDELLRNYLLRNKFSPEAANEAILAYKETIEFVSGFATSYDSASTDQKDAGAMIAGSAQQHGSKTPSISSTSKDDELDLIVSYGYQPKGFVFIKASHGLDPKEAVAMAKKAIESIEEDLRLNTSKSSKEEKSQPET